MMILHSLLEYTALTPGACREDGRAENTARPWAAGYDFIIAYEAGFNGIGCIIGACVKRVNILMGRVTGAL